jgi:zinc transport system substrate-binding protein
VPERSSASLQRFMSMAKVHLALLCSLLGCTRSAEESPAPRDAGPIRVFVSIPPLAYCAERIGGERVAVSVLVAPGQSPERYDPTPRDVATLSRAQLFLGIGLPFERPLLERVSALSKGVAVVDLREGLTLRRMRGDEIGAEERDHAGHEGAPDPHIWLDPVCMQTISRTIAREFERRDPLHAAWYAERSNALQKDLEAVHEKIARILAPHRGKKFYVYHPAFGYFGDRYGLIQEAIELQGREPGAQHLARIIEKARQDGVKVIFVQAQFARTTAEHVAQAIGGAVVPLDPLAHDYLANLESLATALDAALGGVR